MILKWSDQKPSNKPLRNWILKRWNIYCYHQRPSISDTILTKLLAQHPHGSSIFDKSDQPALRLCSFLPCTLAATPSEWPVYGKTDVSLFQGGGGSFSHRIQWWKPVEVDLNRFRSCKPSEDKNYLYLFRFFGWFGCYFLALLVVFWNDHHFTFTGIYVVYYQNKKIIYWRLASDWNRTNKAWNLFDIFCIKNQYCWCAGGSFFLSFFSFCSVPSGFHCDLCCSHTLSDLLSAKWMLRCCFEC